MLSRQDLIKILRLKKITMCTKAFCNRYRCNIKCYTIQRKKLNKKYILNFSFNRKSRKNIFVYREIFFPQDRKIEKKRKSRKIISTRNFHLAKSKKNFFILQKTKQQTFQTQSTSLENSFPPKRTSPKNYIPLPIYMWHPGFFKLF